MKKYKVKIVDVETRDGYVQRETFLNAASQKAYLIGAYATFGEAIDDYFMIKIEVHDLTTHYVNECKFIVETEYNENGELVREKIVEYDFAEVE